MIIRNIAKWHLEACSHINPTTTSNMLSALPLTNLKLAYNFSQQPPNPQQQKNPKKQKMGKNILPNSYLFQLKRFLARHSMLNTQLAQRLSFLSRVFRLGPTRKQSAEKRFNYYVKEIKINRVEITSMILSFFFTSFMLYFVWGLLHRQKSTSDQSLLPGQNIELKKLNLNQSQQIGRQKLQETIATIKKIKITSSSFFEAHADEQQDNSKQSDPKRLYPRKLTSYTIVMQDRNGNQYVADPYQGDPNNFLKYVEMIQEKYHTTDKADVSFVNKEKYTFPDALLGVATFLTPFIPVVISLYLFRRMDPTSLMKNIGKGAKEFKIEAMKDIKTRFKDVAGMEQAKKQITEFVDFLKKNQRYKEIGAKIPKGALLTGPPGTGKTMLARACAGEAGVSFFYISGSEFVEVFVGLGASKVRDLFAKARQNAPSIIFIDEIDAIGKKRQNSRNEQKDTTLNQLLVQMDGFSSSETIIVLAATNRKQILDNALTRPGRFDRMVEINLPDVKAREQIFMVHLAPLKIDPNVEMRVIAKRLSELSPGFSGADIANLCNEAAIIATRKNRDFIIDKDFEQATERITAGYVKKGLMKEKTKKRVAYHEAGHAVASWFLKGGDPLVKLTIIPRSKGALGYAQYLPKTSYIMARNQIIDKIAIMLGGITTEQLIFGQISSGGSDDLQKVYSLTRRMVTQFGMGEQTYNMTLDEQSYIQKQSTYLSNKMEEEVNKILQQARRRSKQIIEDKRDVIQALAKELMEKETLNNDEILKIMGMRPEFPAIPNATASLLAPSQTATGTAPKSQLIV